MDLMSEPVGAPSGPPIESISDRDASSSTTSTRARESSAWVTPAILSRRVDSACEVDEDGGRSPSDPSTGRGKTRDRQ